jgi:hypothetical protein
MNVNTQVKPTALSNFASVAPGSYYLIATNNQGGRNGAHAIRQAIDVGDANLEGVTVAINPGADVTGHVRYDGDAPQPLPSLTVRLTPREMNVGIPPPQPAKVQDDGSFHFEDVNLGSYTVNINTPQGLYLKAVRSGNNDVMVSGLDLTNGAAPLDILMGLNPPQVGGSVVNVETGTAGGRSHGGLDAAREGTAGSKLFLLHHQQRPIRQFHFQPRDSGRISGLRLGGRGIRPVVRPPMDEGLRGQRRDFDSQGRQSGNSQADHDSREIVRTLLATDGHGFTRIKASAFLME